MSYTRTETPTRDRRTRMGRDTAKESIFMRMGATIMEIGSETKCQEKGGFIMPMVVWSTTETGKTMPSMAKASCIHEEPTGSNIKDNFTKAELKVTAQ